MKKQRGSAIVIAVLLTTAVGAVAFGFGKTLALHLTNESLYENGIGAYYAAETGIEEGFLRYRYGRAEDTKVSPFLPAFAGLANPAKEWIDAEDNVVRSDLTSKSVIGNSAQLVRGVDKTSLVLFNAQVTDPNHQYYDLRVGAKTIGENGTVGNAGSGVPDAQLDPEYTIARDESRKIDLGGYFIDGSRDLTLNFKMIPPFATADGFDFTNCTLIEAKFEFLTSTGDVIERKKLLKNSSSACRYARAGIITEALAGSTTVDYVVTGNVAKVTGLKTKIDSILPYSRTTLFLKPIGSDINYSLILPNNPAVLAANPLNNQKSTITSTGYYGGTVRTLEAKVDLSSGSLYDLYDFVIFKK